MPTYSEEIKNAAKLMWIRRVSPKDIAAELSLNSVRVLYQWAEKGLWNDMLQHESVEQATSRQLIKLVEKVNKTDADYKEIDKLSNLLDRCAGIKLKEAKIAREKFMMAQGGNDSGSGSGSSSGSRRSNKSKAKRKNDIGEITEDQLNTVRQDIFFEYQHLWHKNKSQRTRFILKSRQIGATYYFAWEALEDAILTGDNQIFLSASRSQAEVFKAYIIKFGMEYFNLEFKGSDVITLSNGAELRFVSTNGRTAQSYHGHLYIDEVFWIPDFEKLNKLASAMASQKKWRKTYISTPSVKSHGAYPLWSGEKYNEGRKTKIEFDLSAKALAHGQLFKDRIWRNIITLEEAANQGCDLFDIDELKDEYTDAEFNNLFMCAFMEAGQSVFKLNDLLDCAVDSNVVWVDFKRRLIRPYGNLPVWIGYDPARHGDKSSVVVIAPPLVEGGKYRLLEKIFLKGAFTYQANRIKALTEKYNVKFIGIDSTGPGLGVFDLVKVFYRNATPIHYGLNTKTTLVLKGIDVVENGRIEWDAEHADIPQAFLQIRQTTAGNDQITYESNRQSKTGHADVAWSILNALSNEPLSGKRRKASVSIRKASNHA